MIHDVVVCGAGPAGSYAAYLLAGQGLDVVVLDKAAFPREKPCGGALSGKALALAEPDLGPVIERRVTGAWLAYGDGAVRHDAGAIVAAMTRRERFDAYLLDRAIARGATFHPGRAFRTCEDLGDRVRVDTSGGPIEGRLLLGADGVGSAVRRAVFGRRRVDYVPAVEALIEVAPVLLDRFADRVLLDLCAVAGGYGWIFGKTDHLNVGVYSIHGGAGIRAQLDAFVARHPLLRGRSAVRFLGHPIPIRPASAFERGRVWLLGDAAGLAEPVLGEGIYFAMKSAALAAKAIAATGGEPQPGDYERMVRGELGPELAAARHLARACYGRPRLTFERIARNPRASRLFLGLVTGEVGYRECLVKALAGFPGWLVAPREPVAPVASIVASA